jgi:hypothetical protein
MDSSGKNDARSGRAAPPMPTRQTVRNWIISHPAFFSQYGAARKYQADALWDEAMDNIRFADTPLKVARARVFLEATAKLAGKLNPKVYGEVLVEETAPQPQAALDGPSDIVLARRIMYLLHRVMVRQGNGADPGASSA